MNLRKIAAILFSSLAIAGFFALTTPAQASNIYTPLIDGPQDLSRVSDTPIQKIVTSIVNVFLFAGGAAAAIYLVYGGVMYVTAGGDDTKTASARKMIIGAVVGVVLTGAVWIIFSASVSTSKKFSSPNGVTNQEL